MATITIKSNPFWGEKREFSRAEAWFEIYSSADKDGAFEPRVRQWARSWGWSAGRVQHFMRQMERSGLIRHGGAGWFVCSLRAKKAKAKPAGKEGEEAWNTFLFGPCREAFESFYKRKCGEPYYWGVKDAVALKALLQKIRFARKEKSLPVEDGDLLDAFGKFLLAVRDPWMLGNLSMTNLNCKYNEIVASARGGYSTGIVQTDNTEGKYDDDSGAWSRDDNGI